MKLCIYLYECMKVEVKSFSRVRLFVTPWTVVHQAPLSMWFFRQEYWSGLSFPSPGDLPDPGIKPRSPAMQADALTSEPPGKPYEYVCMCVCIYVCVCVCVCMHINIYRKNILPETWNRNYIIEATVNTLAFNAWVQNYHSFFPHFNHWHI